MGQTFPGPGLFSKFYDVDHEPLVEVVRDTVGIHDTFNLACTSKYYEDAGYFGHANCSDNLNEVMEKYGVQKKRGWHAINLFLILLLVVKTLYYQMNLLQDQVIILSLEP